MSDLATISPARASELIAQGATLIDIREADEHARERIPGARHHALSRIEAGSVIRAGDGVLIFHCRSGARTRANAARLLACRGDCDAYVLEGGLDAWKKAGLPVVIDRRQPLELMRQVQIAAGSLILLGVILGYVVAAAFYALAAFVGAGLLFAGITGTCGMARLLSLMPWNRQPSTAAR